MRKMKRRRAALFGLRIPTSTVKSFQMWPDSAMGHAHLKQQQQLSVYLL